MPRSITGLLIVVGFSCTLVSTTPTHAQLIAYWPLDETTGTIAHDLVWDNNPTVNLDGRFGGLPYWHAKGGIDLGAGPGDAIYLHGGNDRIEIPQADLEYDPILDFDGKPMSLACWMRTDGLGWPSAYAHIVGKGSSYRMYAHGTSIKARWRIGSSIINSNINVADGLWHHLCGTFDGSRRSEFYVDGVLQGWDDNVTTPPANTSDWFTIGRNSYYPDFGAMEGWIDEVSLWGHVLNHADINSLKLGRSAPPCVDAGDNQILAGPPPYNTAFHGNITYSGMFFPSPFVTPEWTQIDGPTTASIIPTDSFDPSVSNLAPGVYTFRLAAYNSPDDDPCGVDEIKVWVQASTTVNKELLYLRFEEDITPADPLLLTVVNELPFGSPFTHIPPAADPDYLARLDPNVPLNPIPLTAAANQFSLGKPHQGLLIEGSVEIYPELTIAEEITVEFFADIGDQDDLTFIDFLGAQSGFRIFNPRALKVLYYIKGDAPDQPHRIELSTNINLSDYTAGSGENQVYHPVGWKHIAWTYEKTTGISRIYENGAPVNITHVNGFDYQDKLLYDGLDGRVLVMPPMLDTENNPTRLTIASGVDAEPGARFDEIRITADTLYPPNFLIVGPNLCSEKLAGDFDTDCDVDLFDLALFCNNWLKKTGTIK